MRLDAHVAVGEAGARRVEDFYALGRGSVRSIGNLVPDSGERPVAEHEGFVVGAVGRLDGMKDHALLVRAAARAGARVVVVGEGGRREELLRLAASLEVPLELPGWADDPWRPLAAADVVVLPSRSEGWPLSLVEAMLAGRPVVAARDRARRGDRTARGQRRHPRPRGGAVDAARRPRTAGAVGSRRPRARPHT